MFYGGRVRPSKAASLMGMIVGSVFVILGVTTVIPIFGWFGFLWTFIAVAIAGYHAFNFFSRSGAAAWEFDVRTRGGRNGSSGRLSRGGGYAGQPMRTGHSVRTGQSVSAGKSSLASPAADDFESKLRKLDGLRRDGLITEEEFAAKRKELMEQKW
ncbi:SHOCT domain-containing protein [Paenibacillus sp. MBLB4367]|uniref:SHOCT domain-containing protein n=1 Tax=Paenibacillus sp. MBLB4367 TaxID=3384767 RepID=UPI0039084307